MHIDRPALHVRLAAESALMAGIMILHGSLLVLVLLRILQAPIFCLLLPVLGFSLVRSWQTHVSLSRPLSIRVIRIDAMDRITIMTTDGRTRPARINCLQLYRTGLLVNLDVDRIRFSRTVIIGRKSASRDQVRRWRVRLRQLKDGSAEPRVKHRT